MVLGEERHAVRRSGWGSRQEATVLTTGRRARSVVIGIDLVANVLADHLLDCSLVLWRRHANICKYRSVIP